MTMSDRVAVMNAGELEQVGPPKGVYDDPKTEFVSGFIGQPNTQFFDGRIASTNGRANLEVGSHDLSLPMTADQLDGYLGRDVRVGVRPQYFRVTNDPNEGIPAQHVLDEPLGDETHSFFETEFGELVVVTDPDFEGERREYGLIIDSDEAQLFDPESGVRIA